MLTYVVWRTSSAGGLGANSCQNGAGYMGFFISSTKMSTRFFSDMCISDREVFGSSNTEDSIQDKGMRREEEERGRERKREGDDSRVVVVARSTAPHQNTYSTYSPTAPCSSTQPSRQSSPVKLGLTDCGEGRGISATGDILRKREANERARALVCEGEVKGGEGR